MKLIVHIGLPKAGSTTLQHLLAARRDHLRDHGTLVPTTGYRNDPTAPTRHTPGHDLLALFASAPNRLDRMLTDWVEQAEAANCTQILASSENLTHPYNLADLSSAVAALKATMARLNGEIAFVLIDRLEESWLRSYYNELVLDERSLESRAWPQFASDMAAKNFSLTALKAQIHTALGPGLFTTVKIDAGMDAVLREISTQVHLHLDGDHVPAERKSPENDKIEQRRLANLALKTAPFSQGLQATPRAIFACLPEPVRVRCRRLTRWVLARTTRVG